MLLSTLSRPLSTCPASPSCPLSSVPEPSLSSTGWPVHCPLSTVHCPLSTVHCPVVPLSRAVPLSSVPSCPVHCPVQDGQQKYSIFPHRKIRYFPHRKIVDFSAGKNTGFFLNKTSIPDRVLYAGSAPLFCVQRYNP